MSEQVPDSPEVPPAAPPKSKGGRPSKLTPAVQTEICRAISAANAPLETAALLGGVDYSTLKRWIQKGKEQKRGKFHAFCTAVAKARAECEASCLAGVRAAARGYPGKDGSLTAPRAWQADAWMLEHSFQGRYTKQVRIHLVRELNDALTRLEQAFRSSRRKTLTPEEALELACDAIVGDVDAGTAGALEAGEDHGADSASGEAVRAAPAAPETDGVPRT